MLLGAGSVGHTRRWANGLAEAGARVSCASQHDFVAGDDGWHRDVERIRLRASGPAGYFANAPQLARLYRAQRAELLNAHYASGYGVLATLSAVRPRLVSVWGSDVYDFPRASPLHAALLRGVLARADAVASTSQVMAAQVERVLGTARRRWRGAPAVTPFGVDTALFAPPLPLPLPSSSAGRTAAAPLVIGTVKTLAPKYGVDTLLRAFALLPGLLPDAPGRPPPRLRLVGAGPQRAELEALAATLGIASRVDFAGAVAHARVADWLRGFDIFVAASRLDSESFGVAVVEASACGLPVVVTRAGGLTEVVDDGRTGLVVERDDPAALAGALARLAGDPALRGRLGRAGRAKVQRDYEWRDSVRTMLRCYRDCIDGR